MYARWNNLNFEWTAQRSTFCHCIACMPTHCYFLSMVSEVVEWCGGCAQMAAKEPTLHHLFPSLPLLFIPFWLNMVQAGTMKEMQRWQCSLPTLLQLSLILSAQDRLNKMGSREGRMVRSWGRLLTPRRWRAPPTPSHFLRFPTISPRQALSPTYLLLWMAHGNYFMPSC